MFLPETFVKAKRIDYNFIDQKLPFFLDDTFVVNSVDNINGFLEKFSEELTDFYWRNHAYPFNCKRVSEVVNEKMKKYGLSTSVAHGNVAKQDEYDFNFPFEYVHDSKDEEFYDRITKDISLRHHYYVVGKVENKGIVNEIIFDYSADQFVESRNVVLKETTTAPVIGPRDALRSRYVSLNMRNPHIITPGCIVCR